MKKISIILFYLLFVQITFGQNKIIKVSDRLEITKLSEHTFIHTCDGSNGIIYTNKGEVVIVSTPPTGDVTRELINWVKDSLKVKVIGFVIDSWHPDNIGGLDVANQFGIKSYSNETTQQIAKSKGLPIPQIGFKEKVELNIGNGKLICQYFGPAHTVDGIVIWIPDEQILFGSNAVRNYNGWIGNIGDANISKWSETIEKIRNEYKSAKIVIPGHGNYGGIELLDYTINLYKPSKWGVILKGNNIKPSRIFNDYGSIFVSAEQDSIVEQMNFLKNAVVFVDKGEQYIMIESNSVKHDISNKSVVSDFGRIRILNKTHESSLPETDGYYKNLTVNLRDDAVGITIIMKELIR
jgi:glyoxylase-like metal-dependent hydrolase (beta-lactamase superfamily II)